MTLRNAIKSISSLDLSDKDKRYILFADARVITDSVLRSIAQETGEPANPTTVIMIAPRAGQTLSDCVFAQPIGEYEKKIIAAERERCAQIADNYTDIPWPKDAGWGCDPDEVAARIIAEKIRSGK